MSRINWGKDLGIPVGVGVADVLVAVWDEKRIAANPTSMAYEPIFSLVAAAGGFGMMAGNFYGNVGEVIAHSATPLLVRNAYAWAKSQTWWPSGLSTRRAYAQAVPAGAPVQRMRSMRYGFPAQTDKPEFGFPPLM